MRLVRKYISITLQQDKAIKLLAQKRGTTAANIIRQALDEFLAREGILETHNPFSELIGMFQGPSQVDHDDIYH